MKLAALMGAGLISLAAAPAFASCNQIGYNRVCDGIAGPRGTYPDRRVNGGTTYYKIGWGKNTRHVVQAAPNYSGGYTRKTNTFFN